MNKEIKEILEQLEWYRKIGKKDVYYPECVLPNKKAFLLLDYINNLQQENKIKDTNWESLKYYLEKLYYKDYIEEAISDDIDKKIKELESKVEIKGYQKDIKALQQENERLKVKTKEQSLLLIDYQDMEQRYNDYKSRCEKAIEQAKEKIKRYEGYINDLKKGNYPSPTIRQERQELIFRIREQKDLLNILQNGSDSQ